MIHGIKMDLGEKVVGQGNIGLLIPVQDPLQQTQEEDVQLWQLLNKLLIFLKNSIFQRGGDNRPSPS